MFIWNSTGRIKDYTNEQCDTFESMFLLILLLKLGGVSVTHKIFKSF